MRNGMVLFELLLTLIIVTLMAGFAAPHLSAIADRSAVHGEASHLVEAIDASRAAAIRLNTAVTLTLGDSGFQAVAHAVAGGDSLVAWRSAGPAKAGVVLRAGSGAIIFGPSGLAIGASNRTLMLTRGSASRAVVLSRLGRVTY
jgi:Tfp pilus assembly protein FimT